MIVIEKNIEMSAQEKSIALQLLREDIGEDAFRSGMAAIFTNHYIDLMKYKGKKLTRYDLYINVNMILKNHGCDEVSYSFFRKYNF